MYSVLQPYTLATIPDLHYNSTHHVLLQSVHVPVHTNRTNYALEPLDLRGRLFPAMRGTYSEALWPYLRRAARTEEIRLPSATNKLRGPP